MEKATPFIRIFLYYVAGRLGALGLPQEAVNIIGNDPMLLEAVSWGISFVMVGAVMLWWRIAKRLGWST